MAVNPIGVFVTQETDALFFYHFNKCRLHNSIQVYNNLEQFQQSKHSRKLACLQMPFPVNAEFEPLVNVLANSCDHVLILMSELHDKTVGVVERNDNAKISYFICGELNFDVAHSPIHKFYDWFITSTHFYKHVRPSTLDVLNPYQKKSYVFDALLGRKKLHRDYAHRYLQNPALENKNIVTYINDINCNFNDANETNWIWESEGLEIDKDIEWTVERVPYYGHRMSLSQVIPLKIYNQTAYSLVAETNHVNHYSFYTEKTVKPILASRLFVLLSGRYALRNLQRIGFQTFNGVIDESYDRIEGTMERCCAAMDQVKYLCEQPQEEILAKIKPVCDHNKELMISTDWYGMYFQPAFVAYFNQ